MNHVDHILCMEIKYCVCLDVPLAYDKQKYVENIF
jgi:hypothetical protein